MIKCNAVLMTEELRGFLRRTTTFCHPRVKETSCGSSGPDSPAAKDLEVYTIMLAFGKTFQKKQLPCYVRS
jgi:hypothetical protein